MCTALVSSSARSAGGSAVAVGVVPRPPRAMGRFLGLLLAGVFRWRGAWCLEVAIGQDLWSIRNYTSTFGAPDAVMSYASIGNLSGLWSSTDYGSGVEFADDG